MINLLETKELRDANIIEGMIIFNILDFIFFNKIVFEKCFPVFSHLFAGKMWSN